MPPSSFNLKRTKHKCLGVGPNLCVQTRSGISETDNPPNILGSTRRAGKSSLRPSVDQQGSVSGSGSSSSSSTMTVPGTNFLTNTPIASMSEMVFEPHRYAVLLLQASAERDRLEREGSGASRALHVPPSTSLHSTPPRATTEGSDSREDGDTLVESITYDAILTSNLNWSPGPGGRGKEVPPETRVTPHSPAVFAVQEGGFSSLVGVSLAIMEGRAI